MAKISFSGTDELMATLQKASAFDDETQQELLYAAGDIIMFRSGANTTTHRVTEVTAEGYRTKGDANNTADADTVPPADVLGRVVLTLHGAGAAVRFLRTPLGALCLVLMIPVLVLVPDVLQKKRDTGEDYGRQAAGKIE